MLPTDYRNPELSSKCKNLFENLIKNVITQEDFEKELAYISNAYCINDLKKKELPKTPLSLEIYRKMDNKDKKSFISTNPTFFSEGDVADYLKKSDEINNINERNASWLSKKLGIFQRLNDFKQVNITKEALLSFSIIQHEAIDWSNP